MAIEYFLALASTIITVRCLIRRAWTRHRWNILPEARVFDGLLADALSQERSLNLR